MECLCTLNSKYGNLCQCGCIWHRSQHKTPWVAFRGHSRSHILLSPKSQRGTVYYPYNNVGFSVQNFEGKVW